MEETTDNMQYWQKICKPPEWAIKNIQAGRLKGKSDINPQWRMMAITETFGPCGIGWKYSIDKLWLEKAASVKSREGNVNAEEVAAFALVSVSYKHDGQWSEPIPGIGGSMFTEMEKNGPYNSDEAFKMAVTDALSVAFKALGVAANIYSGDRFDGSKYSKQPSQQGQQQQQAPAVVEPTTSRVDLSAELAKVFHGNKAEMADALRNYSSFTGKGGEKFLTMANLEHPTATESMHKWFTSTLTKMQKDSARG